MLVVVAAALAAPQVGVAQRTPSEGLPVGQLLVGTAGAVSGSFLGAIVGSRLEGDCGGCDDPGLLGAVFGGLAGAAFGAPVTVYAVGELSGGGGSFGPTLRGSLAGMSAFLFLRPVLHLDPDNTPFWVAFWGLPTAGAVIGYQLSVRRPGVRIRERHDFRLSLQPDLARPGRTWLMASLVF